MNRNPIEEHVLDPAAGGLLLGVVRAAMGRSSIEVAPSVTVDWSDDEDCPDPGSALIGLDANALDRDGRRVEATDRFLALLRAGRLICRVGRGVELEAGRTSGADAVREAASLSVGLSAQTRALTAAQHLARIRVRAIVCGNAKAGKHDADAAHLSEAAEAGCQYFITHDGRILRKRDDLRRIALPDLRVVTLEELLSLFDLYDNAALEP